MAKVIQIFFIALLVTILQGFPQNNPSQKPHISNFSQDNHKQDTIPQSSLQRSKEQNQPLSRGQDTISQNSVPKSRDEQHQPLDRSQYSTHDNPSRRTRETDEEIKPLDRSQISTLPAEIKFEDTKIKNSSAETNNRRTRNAEKDGSSEEHVDQKVPGDIKIQPYRPNSEEQESSEHSEEVKWNKQNRKSDDESSENKDILAAN